jgi:hypothetical protein
MGITPITNLTPLPILRPVEKDLGLPPMERVENSTRTGDETYSPSEGRSADDSEDEFEYAATEDEAELEAKAQVLDNGQKRQINFFA